MCNGVPGRVEEWHIPRKAASTLLIANTDCGMTERSTLDSLGNVSWIQKAALKLYRRYVPLLHMSRYVIAHDSVLPGLPLR